VWADKTTHFLFAVRFQHSSMIQFPIPVHIRSVTHKDRLWSCVLLATSVRFLGNLCTIGLPSTDEFRKGKPSCPCWKWITVECFSNGVCFFITFSLQKNGVLGTVR
jgi:hypothetical protein